MSDTPIQEQPSTAQPAPTQQPSSTPPPEPSPSAEEPAQEPSTQPAETDWKAEARKWEARAKENSDAAARLKEFEDAQKTELERANEALTAAQSQAIERETELLQLQAAMATAPPGFDPQQLADWASRLRGSTLEELTADAEALFASITPPAPAVNGQTSQPVESLRPGALPTTPQLNLPEQIAAAEAAGDLAKARDLKAQLFFEQQKKLSQ